MSGVWVEIKNGVVTWVSLDAGNAACHNQVPGCHAERYIQHREAAKRIRELRALVEEARGILIDSMLDEGYSDWMERADKALEQPR